MEETWTKDESDPSGLDHSGVYHSLVQLAEKHTIPTSPDLDSATFVLSQFPNSSEAESRVALIDSVSNARVTYAELRRSIGALAAGLERVVGIRKGDVVLLLSPNSVMYPAICLAVFSVGAVLTTANPLNTDKEVAKQVRDSGAKLAISAPEELHKLVPTGVPTLLTTRPGDKYSISVQELIECCDPSEPLLQVIRPTQSDIAAILYSSGTTGTSKGVLLTHANFIAIMTLLRWSVDVSSAQDDVFLCFLPMFHIYGLAFFALGLFTSGVTTVVMPKFDSQSLLHAINNHKVTNLQAVPPVILGLVKYPTQNSNLSSLRRVASGAAPLSKELGAAFRAKFPRVELRPGYRLTESCGVATFFVSDEEAKACPGSSGRLLPGFSAKVVDAATGVARGVGQVGELWLRSPTLMKGYLGNVEATDASIDSEGWLRTGDICYFDHQGFLYVIDRIKELIKHNGYQVAPAELEAVLLSHPQVLDAAVAPYKKVRIVDFISAIPKSAAGKILRKQLISQSEQQLSSKL